MGPTNSDRLLSLDAFRGFIMILMASSGFGIVQMAAAHPGSWWEIARPHFAKMAFYYQNPPSHARYPGIDRLRSPSSENAQCIIGILEAPEKECVRGNRNEAIMSEIYDLAFRRHADYLSLAYRAQTNPVRRLTNKMRSLIARAR